MNTTSNHEVAGSIPGLAQWVKGSGVARSCGLGCRQGSDPMLLWCRPVAVTLIQSLAWEAPYTMGTALKKKKKKKKTPKKPPPHFFPREIIHCVLTLIFQKSVFYLFLQLTSMRNKDDLDRMKMVEKKDWNSTSFLKTTKFTPKCWAIINQMDWKLSKRYPTLEDKDKATSRGRRGNYAI